MDGFTPTFFLEVLIAVGSAGAMYGAIKNDLKSMHEKIATETRLREGLEAEMARSLHSIRGAVNDVGLKVAKIEGERRAA